MADIEDIVQGRIRAYSDDRRRRSKRQQDLADIMRPVGDYPYLAAELPPAIRKIAE